MLLNDDCHVHTYYSPCARKLDDAGNALATPESYLRQAAELGLRALVFTDHFVEDPSAPGVVMFYKGSGPAILADLRQELARLEDTTGCAVFVGCETETMSTEWVGVSEALSAELDLVLAPTVHYHLPGVPQPASFAPADVASHMLEMLQSVVTKPWLDSVAHPFAEREEVIGDLRAIYEAMDRTWLADVLGLAAENGVALEVNGSALENPGLPHYADMYAEIVRQAKEAGVRFTYGSDAHDWHNLGMTAAVEQWIVNSGLVADDFWSAAEIAAKRR